MILPVLIDAVLGIQHVLCHVSSGISDTGVTSMAHLPLPSVYWQCSALVSVLPYPRGQRSVHRISHGIDYPLLTGEGACTVFANKVH